MSKLPVTAAALLLAGTCPAIDHSGHAHHDHAEHQPTIDLLTGEGIALGETFVPYLYISAAVGTTTADSPADLATAHHDPQDEFTLQTLEPGFSLRLGDHLEAFAIGSFTSDADHHLDGALEEAFLRAHNLPYGLSLRAGRFLNSVGFHNTAHNHAWSFVNNHLLNGRLLQEGELATDGAELTWQPDLGIPFNPAVALSHGRAPSHDDGSHAHEHELEETLFEIENALFNDRFTTASLTLSSPDKVHLLRLSTAWGGNASQRHTQIISLAHQSTIGDSLIWHNEIAHRRFGATAELHHDDHGDHGDHGEEDEHHDELEEESSNSQATLDELALLTALTWSHNDQLTTGLRLGYSSAIAETNRDQRFRLSPNLTYHFGPAKRAHLRLQLDVDHSPANGTDTSSWLQFGYAWGGNHATHNH